VSQAPAATAGFEELVAELEKMIAQLAVGTAPLDELVTAHARATRLLAEAQSRLAGLEERAGELTRLLE